MAQPSLKNAFQKFLKLCKLVTDGDREVVSLIEKRYARTNETYLNSVDFSKLILNTTNKIKEDLPNKYVYLKEFVTELKAYGNKISKKRKLLSDEDTDIENKPTKKQALTKHEETKTSEGSSDEKQKIDEKDGNKSDCSSVHEVGHTGNKLHIKRADADALFLPSNPTSANTSENELVILNSRSVIHDKPSNEVSKSDVEEASEDSSTPQSFANVLGLSSTKETSHTKKRRLSLHGAKSDDKPHPAFHQSLTRVQDDSSSRGNASDRADLEPQPLLDVEVTGGSESEGDRRKVSDKQIRKLEMLLGEISKEIEILEEKELSLDDLEEEDSCYTLIDRYKKKFVKVWNKLCEVKGRDTSSGRISERRFRFEGTRYPEVNRKIEKFINKHKIFPDFQDIRKIVCFCNRKHHLRIGKNTVDMVARDAFTEVGNKLQERRLQDFTSDFGSHLTDGHRSYEDPAVYDRTLRKKLDENKQISKTNIDEVINKYAQKQINETDDDNDDDEEEEEDEEEADGPKEDPEEAEIIGSDDNEATDCSLEKADSNSEDEEQEDLDKPGPSHRPSRDRHRSDQRDEDSDIPILFSKSHKRDNSLRRMIFTKQQPETHQKTKLDEGDNTSNDLTFDLDTPVGSVASHKDTDDLEDDVMVTDEEEDLILLDFSDSEEVTHQDDAKKKDSKPTSVHSDHSDEDDDVTGLKNTDTTSKKGDTTASESNLKEHHVGTATTETTEASRKETEASDVDTDADLDMQVDVISKSDSKDESDDRGSIRLRELASSLQPPQQLATKASEKGEEELPDLDIVVEAISEDEVASSVSSESPRPPRQRPDRSPGSPVEKPTHSGKSPEHHAGGSSGSKKGRGASRTPSQPVSLDPEDGDRGEDPECPDDDDVLVVDPPESIPKKSKSGKHGMDLSQLIRDSLINVKKDYDWNKKKGPLEPPLKTDLWTEDSQAINLEAPLEEETESIHSKSISQTQKRRHSSDGEQTDAMYIYLDNAEGDDSDCGDYPPVKTVKSSTSKSVRSSLTPPKNVQGEKTNMSETSPQDQNNAAESKTGRASQFSQQSSASSSMHLHISDVRSLQPEGADDKRGNRQTPEEETGNYELASTSLTLCLGDSLDLASADRMYGDTPDDFYDLDSEQTVRKADRTSPATGVGGIPKSGNQDQTALTQNSTQGSQESTHEYLARNECSHPCSMETEDDEGMALVWSNENINEDWTAENDQKGVDGGKSPPSDASHTKGAKELDTKAGDKRNDSGDEDHETSEEVIELSDSDSERANKIAEVSSAECVKEQSKAVKLKISGHGGNETGSEMRDLSDSDNGQEDDMGDDTEANEVVDDSETKVREVDVKANSKCGKTNLKEIKSTLPKPAAQPNTSKSQEKPPPPRKGQDIVSPYKLSYQELKERTDSLVSPSKLRLSDTAVKMASFTLKASLEKLVINQSEMGVASKEDSPESNVSSTSGTVLKESDLTDKSSSDITDSQDLKTSPVVPASSGSRQEKTSLTAECSSSNQAKTSPISSSGNQAKTSPISSSGNQAKTSPISSSGNQAKTSPISSSGNQAKTSPISSSGNQVKTSPISSSGNQAKTSTISSSGNQANTSATTLSSGNLATSSSPGNQAITSPASSSDNQTKASPTASSSSGKKARTSSPPSPSNDAVSDVESASTSLVAASSESVMKDGTAAVSPSSCKTSSCPAVGTSKEKSLPATENTSPFDLVSDDDSETNQETVTIVENAVVIFETETIAESCTEETNTKTSTDSCIVIEDVEEDNQNYQSSKSKKYKIRPEKRKKVSHRDSTDVEIVSASESSLVTSGEGSKSGGSKTSNRNRTVVKPINASTTDYDLTQNLKDICGQVVNKVFNNNPMKGSHSKKSIYHLPSGVTNMAPGQSFKGQSRSMVTPDTSRVVRPGMTQGRTQPSHHMNIQQGKRPLNIQSGKTPMNMRNVKAPMINTQHRNSMNIQRGQVPTNMQHHKSGVKIPQGAARFPHQINTTRSRFAAQTSPRGSVPYRPRGLAVQSSVRGSQPVTPSPGRTAQTNIRYGNNNRNSTSRDNSNLVITGCYKSRNNVLQTPRQGFVPRVSSNGKVSNYQQVSPNRQGNSYRHVSPIRPGNNNRQMSPHGLPNNTRNSPQNIQHSPRAGSASSPAVVNPRNIKNNSFQGQGQSRSRVTNQSSRTESRRSSHRRGTAAVIVLSDSD